MKKLIIIAPIVIVVLTLGTLLFIHLNKKDNQEVELSETQISKKNNDEDATKVDEETSEVKESDTESVIVNESDGNVEMQQEETKITNNITSNSSKTNQKEEKTSTTNSTNNSSIKSSSTNNQTKHNNNSTQSETNTVIENKNTNTQVPESSSESSESGERIGPWTALGMTEDQYYNKPMWSWARVDFKTMQECIEYGDKYEPYLNGEVLYSCNDILSASGNYLGVMFDTEKLQ